MSAFSRFYKIHIGEGKSILYFSIVFAVLIKIIYFLYPTSTLSVDRTGGHLWTVLAPFVENRLISFILSSAILVLIAFMVSYINTKYVLISKRTFLPSAIAVLLFSCMPQQIIISPYYIGVVFMLLSISTLFRGYGGGVKQMTAFSSSFFLLLGSLFAPVLVFYMPLLWVCLARVRALNFKSLLSTIFSILLVYFPVFTYFLSKGSLGGFIFPFSEGISHYKDLPLMHYETLDYVILSVTVLLVLIILADYSVNSFKDKIRVRVFLSVLTIISIVSLLCTVLLSMDAGMTRYILFVTGALQLGHLFAPSKHKAVPVLFYLLTLFIVIISFLTV